MKNFLEYSGSSGSFFHHLPNDTETTSQKTCNFSNNALRTSNPGSIWEWYHKNTLMEAVYHLYADTIKGVLFFQITQWTMLCGHESVISQRRPLGISGITTALTHCLQYQPEKPQFRNEANNVCKEVPCPGAKHLWCC
jgi:hypothetical protein